VECLIGIQRSDGMALPYHIVISMLTALRFKKSRFRSTHTMMGVSGESASLKTSQMLWRFACRHVQVLPGENIL